MVIQVLSYDVQDIGKHMKKSKRRFTWRFSIDKSEHTVDLVVSYLSGKKKVSLDDRVLYEGQKVMSTSFQFPFSIGANMCNIVQHGEQFELRINNQVFAHLYDQVKMQREFVYEDPYRKKSNDFGSKDDDDKPSYKEKSSYGAYSNTSYKKDESYGSNKNESYGSTKNDTGSYKVDKQEREKSPSSYYSRSSAWDDVRKAEKKIKAVNTFAGGSKAEKVERVQRDEDDDPGFSKAFDKFDISGKQSNNNDEGGYKSKFSVKSGGSGGDDFSSFPVPEKKTTTNTKSGFDGFSGFDNFGNFGDSGKNTKQSSGSNNAFGGFGDFSNFSGSTTQTTTKTTSSSNSNDLLGLDFGGPTQTKTTTNNNSFGGNSGFDDFAPPVRT